MISTAENGNQVVIQVKDDKQHLSRAANLVTAADALKVTSDLEQDQAAELGRDLKTYLEEAEKYFAPEIEAAHKLHKSLCAKRNAVIDPLKAALQRLGGKLGIYQDAQRRKKAEEEEKARLAAEAAEKKKQDELLEKAADADAAGKTEKAEELLEKAENVYVAPRPVAPVSKPAGVALLFNVEVIVKDAKKIPDQYKIVDEAKLKRHFKESKYTMEIPGVVFVKKPVSSFRA